MSERQESARAGRTIPEALRAIVVATGRQLWDSRGRWAATWGVALVATLALYPYDRILLDGIQAAGADWRRVAEVTSTIGRFENSSLLFAVVLATIGLLAGADRWKRAAVACLIAGILSGLAVTVLRPGIGRARPHAEAEPGFYIAEIDSDFHSMPSGHASTNVASAVAIARLLPPLAPPALAYAGVVCWSRLQLDRHYPTDILWGITLGATLGWTVAGAVAGRRREDRSRSTGPS